MNSVPFGFLVRSIHSFQPQAHFAPTRTVGTASKDDRRSVPGIPVQKKLFIMYHRKASIYTSKHCYKQQKRRRWAASPSGFDRLANKARRHIILLFVSYHGSDHCNVRYYAVTDYLHVLKLIGSDCTAFGIGCTAYLCNVSFRYVRVQV